MIRSSWAEGAVLSAMQLLKRQYSDVIDPLRESSTYHATEVINRLDESRKENSSEEIRKENNRNGQNLVNHWRAMELKNVSKIEEDSKQVRHRRNPRS